MLLVTEEECTVQKVNKFSVPSNELVDIQTFAHTLVLASGLVASTSSIYTWVGFMDIVRPYKSMLSPHLIDWVAFVGRLLN